MSNSNIYSEIGDVFIIRHLKMISELYEEETFLNDKILSTKLKKTEKLILLDKEWLENWKNIICYEKLKEKCIKCKTTEDFKKEIKEVRDLFIQSNTKQKLDELGKMDNSILKKVSNKVQWINEESDFIPVLASLCIYFMKSIHSPFIVNSEISNGIIYIYNPFPEKNKEQKLILLFKDSEEYNYLKSCNNS